MEWAGLSRVRVPREDRMGRAYGVCVRDWMSICRHEHKLSRWASGPSLTSWHVFGISGIQMSVFSVAQSCPALCSPLDCSLPGSSARGIFQARILEWVTIPFSRGSSRPRDQTRISCVSCTDRRVLCHEHHLGSLYLDEKGAKLPLRKKGQSAPPKTPGFPYHLDGLL